MKPAVFKGMVRETRLFRQVLLVLAAIAACLVGAQADELESFSVPLMQQSSGAFYIRGTLGESVAADLLVDTGSSYVALSQKTFDALQRSSAMTYVRSIKGATANGRVVKAKVYEVSALAIGDECVLESVEAVVLPGADRDILGLSALKRVEPFTFDLEPLALRFEACR
ncbi:MAG: retropepsin-like aspartic protease [Woeseiaceae bacterium]|nr:retropepsin-like aspartic protease [Woeseiaceae bacterium]